MLAVEATRKMPAHRASGKIKAEQVITLRHCVNSIALAHDVRRDAEIFKVTRADEILPTDFSARALEGVDVTLPSCVRANHDQIVCNKRVIVKAALVAILLDVIAPAELAVIFVESVEIARAGTDEK